MIKSYNPNNSISSPDKLDEDKSNENSLRPSRFSEFTGQQDIIENLNGIFSPKKLSELKPPCAPTSNAEILLLLSKLSNIFEKSCLLLLS